MHITVMLDAAIELLAIKPAGIYCDGTLGFGGHSRAILDKLTTNGRLFAFDRDLSAINAAQQSINDERVTILHANFTDILQELQKYNINSIDGILLDLGTSSMQLLSAERGFSFRLAAPLDMRMDVTQELTAAIWVNTAPNTELADIFWRYGEEKYSSRIAKAIVNARAKNKITTTVELAALIANIVPAKPHRHPATKVFQAIRIHINQELTALQQILDSAPLLLRQSGRMVVISFHSLEDRLVKHKFTALSCQQQLPRWDMSIQQPVQFRIIAKKLKASPAEILHNPGSRSAIMRAIECVVQN